MENMNYELVAQMLREFVIDINQELRVPDICKKGASAIETLLSQNEKMKDMLIGNCSACEHVGDYAPNCPCDTCIRNSRVRGNGWGVKDNWKLKSFLGAPNPAPNVPFTLEEVRRMAEKPYWHVGLRTESAPAHWAILPSNIAKNPQDYHYGEYWLAYPSEVTSVQQLDVKSDSMPASDNDPLSMDYSE